MPTNVVMPQLGESVVEGTVSRWLKQPGEAVTEFEPLLEVSTDKVDTEIPSPAGGVLLRVLVGAGETVSHGTVLAEIGEKNETPSPDPSPTPLRSVGEGNTLREAENGNGHHEPYTGHVTPVVARMAAEHRLDLNRIPGTGRDGRITKRDVEQYLEAGASAPAAPSAASVDPWDQPGSGDLFKPTVDYSDAGSSPLPYEVKRSGGGGLVADPKQTPSPNPSPTIVGEGNTLRAAGTLIPLTAMRRAIAEHMVRSKLHTSPHVTTVFEVDLTAVNAHRAAHKAEFARADVPLTLTAYFVMATAAALRAVPSLNSEWREDGIFQHAAQHIGMAVALDDGLIVPVIRHAGDLNLIGTARAVTDLAHRARAKHLKADDVVGGTFTITNHGTAGSLLATPIINQPQVGILGVGAMEKRVKVITDAHGNDMIAIRSCAYLSLTFDHRVVDGAGGDAFLAHIKRTLESWM